MSSVNKTAENFALGELHILEKEDKTISSKDAIRMVEFDQCDRGEKQRWGNGEVSCDLK